MSFKMNNGFSDFSSYYLRHINDFLNETGPLPKKPVLPFDDNYFNVLKLFETETQEYYILFCNYLYNYLIVDDNRYNGRIRDAFYKIRNDYKEYKIYLLKAKEDYNESKQIEKYPRRSMSPSNPCYCIEDDSSDIYSTVIEPMNGDCFILNENKDDGFIKELKKLKKLVKDIKKRNKKKPTKNQRKKLKKKIKIDSDGQIVDTLKSTENCTDICETEDPQIMVQNFFKTYAQTGEWSWSRWNNYFAKIQQINPTWFDLFNQYSNEMGISWQAMFTRYINSQVENCETSYVMTSYQVDHYNESLNLNPDEGKSVIFTPDVVRLVDESDTNELFCSSCNHEFKTQRAFHIHIRGVKHIQNEINHVKHQKPEKFITEVEKENAVILTDLSKEEKHQRWLLYNEDNSKVPGNYTCTTCNIVCSSQKDLLTHISGEKHHTNSGSPLTIPIVDKCKRPTVRHKTKILSRIQVILDTCTQPLIGLNYITEYQRLDELLECKYICDLCKVKFERKSFIQHVVSYKHRETYLRYAHHKLYDILRQDLSAKMIKMKRMDVFSIEVENFEGRRKMNIMIEKEPLDDATTDYVHDTKQSTTSFSENFSNNNSDNQEVPSRSIKLNDFFNEDMLDLSDKEDGEVESSDEESVLIGTKISMSDDTKVGPAQSRLKEELEAGEIENNVSDIEDDITSTKMVGEVEHVEKERSPELDMSEFVNYELAYRSDRQLIPGREDPTRKRRIDFIQLKDRKRVRLKEVTTDIIDYFKQEAIWALQSSSRIKDNDTRGVDDRDLPGALLLRPQSQPIGPVYAACTSYYSKSKRPVHEVDDARREVDVTNILDRVQELITESNGVVSDPALWHQAQNMLVNWDSTDCKLNAALRDALLLPGRESMACSTSSRKPLLAEPISVEAMNIEAISETLDKLQQLTNQNLLPLPSVATASSPGEVRCYRMEPSTILGDKLSRRADFLGVGQPPPPSSFPKFPPVAESRDFAFYQNQAPFILPFYSPGMIEHHQSLWAHYPPSPYKPYFPPNISPPSLMSDAFTGFRSSNS